MRGRPCFTEHLLEFAREKQGGNAAVLFTALFSFCPIIDPAWRVRAVRHLKRGFMSVFHWIEKIPIRIGGFYFMQNTAHGDDLKNNQTSCDICYLLVKRDRPHKRKERKLSQMKIF